MEYQNLEEIRLTQQLVRIESSNPGAYEGALSDFVEQWLKEQGADVVRDPVAPGRDNIVARIPGCSSEHNLVYICHMDTVPLGTGWDWDPLGGELRDDKILGRGSCDMKSGLACGMVAFAHILKSGKKPKYDFVFIASVDEEDLMIGAEQAVKSGYIHKDSWVLDSEPTNGIIQVAHKGKTWFKLTTHGLAAHASTPERGYDAVAAMGEIIHEIRAGIAAYPSHEEMGPCSATFGTIEGGVNTNIVPDSCTVGIDMRLVPPTTNAQSIDMVHKAIETGLARVPGVTCECVITAQRPALERDDESFLFRELKAACRAVNGVDAPVDFFPGYTDSAVAAAVTGSHNCMSYGPGDLALAHKPNELVPCADIVRCAKVMKQLAEQILF